MSGFAGAHRDPIGKAPFDHGHAYSLYQPGRLLRNGLEPWPRDSRGRHETFVDVSEQGTEAAATAGIAVHAAMRMPEQVVVFRADQSFIFLIRNTRTEVVLFIGRLMNPR
jgi:hypothetical protein